MQVISIHHPLSLKTSEACGPAQSVREDSRWMKADLSLYDSEVVSTVEPTSARTLEPSRRSQRCRLLQLCYAFIARISCPPLLLLFPALTSRAVARISVT